MREELTDGFKSAFRGHPSGVTIITADDGTGPAGLTMSSVASVSVEPPVLSFSVSTRKGSASTVLHSASLLVHLLDVSNVDLAHTFAQPGSPRFGADMRWSPLPTGEPWLEEVPTALRCEPIAATEIGDSTIVTARVVEIIAGTMPASRPLVHYNRTFFDLGQGIPIDTDPR